MEQPQVHPLPTKCMPDWGAVAEKCRAQGPYHLPGDVPYASGRLSLRRFGVSLRPIRESGVVVAHRVSLQKASQP